MFSSFSLFFPLKLSLISYSFQNKRTTTTTKQKETKEEEQKEMSEFMSMSSPENQSERTRKTPSNLLLWQQRIHEVQNSRLTPEIRERILTTASHKQRIIKSTKTAKRLEKANYLSATSNMLTLQRFQSPQSEYMESSARTKKWSSAIQNSVQSRVMNEEDEENYERQLDEVSAELQSEVLRQQEVTPNAPSLERLNNVQVFDQMSHQERIHQHNTITSELESLLSQLIREPTNDEELLAKFTLYETFLETVITLRNEITTFWSDNQDLFDNYSRQAAQREIASIDTPETMGIIDDPTKWFVYHMTKKVNENNKLIGNILSNLRKRLEMMNTEGDLGECPFCLENMTEMVKIGGSSKTLILTCCHRVCSDCWENWVEIKGNHGVFCPLCRHEQFVEEVLNNGV